MNLKPIHTKKDYKETLNRIDELIARNPKEVTDAFNELDILGTLVIAYEEVHYKIEAPDPALG